MAYVRIPNLNQANPIVDSQGRPTPEFMRRLNDTLQSLAVAINAIAALPEIQAALTNLDMATQAALDAAAAAQASTDTNQREFALQNSYIDPASVLTATPGTVNIDAHVRKYADGTQVSVSAGFVPATAVGDTDYIFYLNPSRSGGAVAYQVSTTMPVQTGDTHVVGAVNIPASGNASGGNGPRNPGFVVPDSV